MAEKSRHLPLRIVTMLVGIALVACAIALCRHAGIGTTAINSPAAVTAEVAKRTNVTWLTLGVTTFALNFALFLGQVLLLRRDFQPFQTLQLAILLVFSTCVDLWASLFDAIVFDSYPPRLVACVIGAVVMALGVYLELRAGLLMTPGDAFVRALSQVTGHPYSRDKVIVDVCLVSLGAILSVSLLGGLYHVREGTLVSALLVGPTITLWGKLLDGPMDRLLGERKEQATEEAAR